MDRLQELTNVYVEMYKDVYGVKARWARFATVAEATAALDQLSTALAQVQADEQAAQASAIRFFEARVAAVIATGASTRADALRWIHEAEGTNGDDEFLCYSVGLPYGYFGTRH